MFEDKTQNNIMMDLVSCVSSDMSTEEGSLIDHSFRGAATELEKAYIELELLDQNGYAETADREHLILRAKEKGITPFDATNAVWIAEFNTDVPLNTRFSAGDLTFECTEKLEERKYKIMCEQSGTIGNAKQDELLPIEYIEGFDNGKMTEILIPARNEEETEDFRARYLSIVAENQAFGGNRAQYKKEMHEIAGVGPCKIYRVTTSDRRIKIYFLNSFNQLPSDALVANVQEIIDPIEKQGEGAGIAPIFHRVDICPCIQKVIDIETKITLDTGYILGELMPTIQERIDSYYLEIAKNWENENYLTVRILKINASIASVEGVVDVQGTALNGIEENILLNSNEIPVRGVITCRE